MCIMRCVWLHTRLAQSIPMYLWYFSVLYALYMLSRTRVPKTNNIIDTYACISRDSTYHLRRCIALKRDKRYRRMMSRTRCRKKERNKNTEILICGLKASFISRCIYICARPKKQINGHRNKSRRVARAARSIFNYLVSVLRIKLNFI